MSDIQMPLALDDIEVPEGRRTINAATVKRLAESIDKIGLRHPITVRRKGDRYILVAGLHRMEACRKLGREHVPATIVSMTNSDARLWEISENLHRADLGNIVKAECIDEWRKLTAEKVGNGSPGVRKTAEILGVDHKTVSNSKAIASISSEAKAAAEDAGVTGVRELKEVAKEPTPQKQTAKVVELASRDKFSTKTWRDDYAKLWARGTEDDHAWAREYADKPVMDRRFK